MPFREEHDERRHSVRVLADCPAIYRILEGSGAKHLEEQRSGLYHIPALPSMDIVEKVYKKLHGRGSQNSDPDVLELLLWLDWKISFMIKTLPNAKDEQVFPYRMVVRNLSADGLNIHTVEAAKVGAMIELELILPVLPFREMFLKGEIMWCKPIAQQEDGTPFLFDAGLAFRDLSQNDKEHVISYVVRRQMQLQRERQLAE